MIAVKDMKMPHSCNECPCEIPYSLLYGKRACGVTMKYTMEFNATRRDDCPLSEIPEHKTGQWLELDDCMTICSECNALGCGSKYCPNCGAMMTNANE